MNRRSAHAPHVPKMASALFARYGDWAHYNRKNPLEELLFIVCSIQTNEALYRGTFAELRRAFPSFDLLAQASVGEIARAIARGGLSSQKARLISKLMAEITKRLGRATLAPLKRMTDKDRERFLTSLPGVGRKTARCVMMYSLGSQVFPVDTHCWRICRRLGWIRPTRPDRSCSPKDMDRLQCKVPPELRFSLHVNLVSLGREICTPRRPRCTICPVRTHCRRIGVRDSR